MATEKARQRRRRSADESSSAAESEYLADRERELQSYARELLHGLRLADQILFSVEEKCIPRRYLTDLREIGELVEKLRHL